MQIDDWDEYIFVLLNSSLTNIKWIPDFQELQAIISIFQYLIVPWLQWWLIGKNIMKGMYLSPQPPVQSIWYSDGYKSERTSYSDLSDSCLLNPLFNLLFTHIPPSTLLLCTVRIRTQLLDNYEIISHSYELYIFSTIEKVFHGWQVSPIDTLFLLIYVALKYQVTKYNNFRVTDDYMAGKVLMYTLYYNSLKWF